MVLVGILLILALVALFGLFQITGSIIGLLLTVLVAAIIGYIADLIVPGNNPYGFLGAALAGILGSWLGVLLLGTLGPIVFDIPIISALIGAVIVTLIYALISNQLGGSRRRL